MLHRNKKVAALLLAINLYVAGASAQKTFIKAILNGKIVNRPKHQTYHGNNNSQISIVETRK